MPGGAGVSLVGAADLVGGGVRATRALVTGRGGSLPGGEGSS